MSIGVARFVVEDEELFRVSGRLFEELWEGTASIQRFASRTIWFVEVYLEFKARKPVKIYEIRNELFQFTQKGCIDRDAILEEAREVAGLSSFTLLPNTRRMLGPFVPVDNKVTRIKPRRTLNVHLSRQLQGILNGSQRAPLLKV